MASSLSPCGSQGRPSSCSTLLLPPHSKDSPVTHAGLDILFVLEGDLVLDLDGTDYPLAAGECVVWPSSHEHAIRNDSDTPARAIGLVTETG